MVKTRTKLLFIVPSLIRGGVERVVTTLSQVLSQDFDVFIVVYHGPLDFNVDVQVINLNTPTGSVKRKLKNIWIRVKRLREMIDILSPDFVISFMGNLHPILTFKPVVVSIRNNPDFFHLFRKLFLKTLYQLPHIQKVIVPSRELEQKLRNSYGLKNSRTIYNPIDFNYIDQQMTDVCPLEFEYILAVGRLAKQKRHDLIIMAYASSEKLKQVKLIILGEGSERKNLEKIISEYDMEDRVMLLGNQENPYIYMKHARFLVQSSGYEGLSNVILEALACGIPVIATECKYGMKEIIENNSNGILVPSGDVLSLREAMEKLMQDQTLYRSIKINARKSVERFDVTIIADEWKRLFTEMKNHKEE